MTTRGHYLKPSFKILANTAHSLVIRWLLKLPSLLTYDPCYIQIILGAFSKIFTLNHRRFQSLLYQHVYQWQELGYLLLQISLDITAILWFLIRLISLLFKILLILLALHCAHFRLEN